MGDLIKHPNLTRAGLGSTTHHRRTPKLLKEAIMEAAERLGDINAKGPDGKKAPMGKDGLVGYLMMLGRDYPKTFASLIARVLPMQVTGEGGGPLRIVDETMNPREAAEIYAEALRNIPGLADTGPDIDLLPGDFREVLEQDAREHAED